MHTTDSDRSLRATTRPSRRSARLTFALAALVGAACTESIPPTPIASLRISPGADSFFVGRTTSTAPFAVSMLDANNTEIRDGRAITYTSSAPDVFAVDGRTGILTAKAAGSGLYRASVAGRFIEATVKVIHPVDKVVLNTGDFSLSLGSQPRQITVTVLAPDGSAISGRTMNFSSSQPSVASVSTTGLVTALSEGTATIYVGVEGKIVSVVVTVTREVVASIQLNPPVGQLMRIGGQLQVTATPRSAANLPLAGRTVTWFTNNPTVATVTAQGLVAAVGVGNATITAECEGKMATLQVAVTLIPVGSVTFTQVADTLIPNDQKQFNPVVRDTAGNVITSLLGRAVAYTASNNLVVSTAAAAAGVIVTAQTTVGSAMITATIDNVSSTAPLSITVPQVDQVSIAPTQATVPVGGTVSLTVTIKDANGNSLVVNRPIIGFASNAPAVATVPPSGGQLVTVTARAAGTATITAVVNGFTASATITVP